MSKKLSPTQLETLVDIYHERPIKGRSNTIRSLLRRDLIEKYDDGYELTDRGLAVIDTVDFDEETGDVIEAAFYLGKMAVEKPELIAIAAVGAVLGGLVRRISK